MAKLICLVFYIILAIKFRLLIISFSFNTAHNVSTTDYSSMHNNNKVSWDEKTRQHYWYYRATEQPYLWNMMALALVMTVVWILEQYNNISRGECPSLHSVGALIFPGHEMKVANYVGRQNNREALAEPAGDPRTVRRMNMSEQHSLFISPESWQWKLWSDTCSES